jgi:hypothetical protein
MTARFRGATFNMIRPRTSITARAESGLGRAGPCTRARPFCIVRASSTVTYARSNHSAAQKNHHARSRAMFMSMPEMLPGRSLAPKTSSCLGSASAQEGRDAVRTSERILKLGRLRLRGPRGSQDEFVLAAIAQNLRGFASLDARPPLAQALRVA